MSVCVGQLLLRKGPALEWCSINHNRDIAKWHAVGENWFSLSLSLQVRDGILTIHFFSVLGLRLAGGYAGHVRTATISVSSYACQCCCVWMMLSDSYNLSTSLPLDSWASGEGLDEDTSFKIQLSKPLTLHIALLWGVYVNSHPLKEEAFLMSRCH